MVRLFENKDVLGLTCDKIAALLNTAKGVSFEESTYRKYWKAFNEGRGYERRKQMDGVVETILGISDLHIPYQLPISTFSNYAGSVDTLVINGDVSDMQTLSRFDKKYRNNPIDELVETRSYLIELIASISPRRVIINYGNHDLRLGDHLAKALDNEIKDVLPDTQLELIVCDGFTHYDKKNGTKTHYDSLISIFKNSGIDVVYSGKWWCKVGNTIFAHPKAYSSGMLKTAEKAVNYFLRIDRTFTSIVLAHTHKLGSYIQGNINLYEQGACCKIEASAYCDGQLVIPQQRGFIVVRHDENGNLMSEKTVLERV